MNEMNQINNLVNTIRNQLQNIRLAGEATKLGWEWSQDMIEVADSLYYQQIPKQWCYLSGSASEFTHYPLASFINDLTTRFQHIDKCLTLVSLLLALMVR